MIEPCNVSSFSSKKENPKTPKALGFSISFFTIKLSFSPASIKGPSSLINLQVALYFFLSCFLIAFKAGNVLQPPSIANS